MSGQRRIWVKRRLLPHGQMKVIGRSEHLLELPAEEVGVSLTTEEGGTVYPIFVSGVHNPDDGSVVRWVL